MGSCFNSFCHFQNIHGLSSLHGVNACILSSEMSKKCSVLHDIYQEKLNIKAERSCIFVLLMIDQLID